MADAPTTGADLVIRALETAGVDTVFGIPGVHTLALYDALLKSKLRHVLARHEQGIGFMADGYARASGKTGVAFVITGPGVTNIATALGQAYTDSSPVLTIASNNPTQWVDGMRGALHDLKDQIGVLRSVTKSAVRVTSAADAGNTVLGSLTLAQTGRPLPVAVEFPLDVLDAQVAGPINLISMSPTKTAPQQAQIEYAANRLQSAKRTVIYCGGGAVSSANPEAIARLAEILHAPVLTSIQGKGAIPADNPYFAGTAWAPGNAADDLLQRADCLLVLGSRMGVQATHEFKMTFPREIIRVDIDPLELNLNVQPTLGFVADVSLTATALVDAMAGHDHAEGGYSTEEIAAARDESEAGSYHAERREWPDAIRAALDRDGILATDMTQMAYVATALYPVYEPRTFLFPNGYGTLGFGLPAAIGAKIGCPDKQVVCVVGDGGFQYSMGELAVAIQEKLGLPIVIFNDNTYSAVKEAQKWERGERYNAVDLQGSPDFQKLAAAYGIPSRLVNTPSDLTAEIKAAFGRSVPTILEVPTEQWI
jgi:thiamine pyrophosphate-dependent acetolactate synthase large subunit-like protein